MTDGTWAITDLRAVPAFCEIVAARIWKAWTKAEGAALAAETALVQACLAESLVPSCFVAHAGTCFLATASIVAADLPIRPHYSPWLASLWVEPEARGRGIASALIEHALTTASGRGCDALTLYCVPGLGDFYGRRGWALIERDVGPGKVLIMRRGPLSARDRATEWSG